MKQNSRKGRRHAPLAAVALLLAVGLSLLAPAFSVSAYTGETEPSAVSSRSVAASPVKNYLAVSGITNLNTWQYASLPLRYGGRDTGLKLLRINGTYYIPVRAFSSSISGLSVSYNSSSRTLTVSGGGLYMTATDGSYVVYANDRALFSMTPARVMSDGRMYIPAETLAKAYGLTFSVTGSYASLSGEFSPLVSAARFYDADSVYWLSRIISAESRGEPLIGQIAVGNVILNRVRSKSFPNTIWGVIFDKKYGIQFSPVANGTIYNAPAYSSVLAAKICLEGFSVSEDIIYFLAPRYAESSWISKNRSYEFTVKNHEFYS